MISFCLFQYRKANVDFSPLGSQNSVSQVAQQKSQQLQQQQQQPSARPKDIRLSISLKRAVLEVLNMADKSAVNGGGGNTGEDVRRYIAECTFFGTCQRSLLAKANNSGAADQLLEAAIEAVVNFLLERRLIYRERVLEPETQSFCSDLNNNNSHNRRNSTECDSGQSATEWYSSGGVSSSTQSSSSSSSSSFSSSSSSSSNSSSSLARLHISLLGKAVVASGLSPDDAPFYQAELETASRRLCLFNDLHLVYLLTPTYLAEQYAHRLDWTYYLYEVFLKGLSAEERAIATELIGIEEGYLYGRVAATGGTSTEPAKGTAASAKLMTHRRFYIALALYDLVRERPLAEVGRRYRLERATLQKLQQDAATFAGQLQIFAARLRWTNLELLFEAFQPRLNFGVHRELLELMRLPWLTVALARRLAERGLATIAALATAPTWKLEEALILTKRFEQKKQLADGSSFEDGLPQLKASSADADSTRLVEYIPADSAYLSVRELAKRLKADARALLGADLGVQERLMESLFAGGGGSLAAAAEDCEVGSGDQEDEKMAKENVHYVQLDEDIIEELMVDISFASV